MEVLYLLIPLSVVLLGVIVAAFLWAVHRGQFEDLERHGREILLDDDDEQPRARRCEQRDAEEGRGQ